MSNQKAILVDRGGVIHRDFAANITGKPKDLIMETGVIHALKEFQKEQTFLTIFLDNCSGVALEHYAEEVYNKLTDLLKKNLARHSIRVDAWYCCAHHPEGKGIYRKDSVFRFPNVGLIKQAQQEHELDLSRCWLIGDRTPELLAGERAQCNTILVPSGVTEKDGGYIVEPDYVAKNLSEALRYIQQQELALTR